MITEKKWGCEETLINNGEYCGKILHINHGWRTSNHFHKNKLETFYVLSGVVKINSRILTVGEVMTIKRGQLHYLLGITNARVLEVSTHHEDSDSYRTDVSCKTEGDK